jgi:hypothetical protein
LPTPNSKDGTIGETLRPGETITATGGLPRRGVTETSDGYSLTLGRLVQMFPTPTGDDANNATPESGAFQSLTRAVSTRGSDGTDGDPSIPSGTGSLNPQFVEWLMGFPLEWSKVED